MSRKDLIAGLKYTVSTGSGGYKVKAEIVEPHGSAIVVYRILPGSRISYTTVDFALKNWTPA